jgi:hypothetical protein
VQKCCANKGNIFLDCLRLSVISLYSLLAFFFTYICGVEMRHIFLSLTKEDCFVQRGIVPFERFHKNGRTKQKVWSSREFISMPKCQTQQGCFSTYEIVFVCEWWRIRQKEERERERGRVRQAARTGGGNNLQSGCAGLSPHRLPRSQLYNSSTKGSSSASKWKGKASFENTRKVFFSSTFVIAERWDFLIDSVSKITSHVGTPS